MKNVLVPWAFRCVIKSNDLIPSAELAVPSSFFAFVASLNLMV